MEFWMNLMFGNSVGLMSMLVIIGTFLLISAYAVYFIYKVMSAKVWRVTLLPTQANQLVRRQKSCKNTMSM